MTDSATSASPGGSKPPDNTTPSNILERLESYKDDHPTAVDYWIETEMEAAQLLIAMAASLDSLAKDLEYDKVDAGHLTKFSRQYKAIVCQGKAINYLRNISDQEAIAICGMRIRARRIVLQ